MLRVHTWIGLNFLILTSLLFSGCALAPKLPDLPRDANLIRGQLQIHSDFELPQRHRLLDELTAQRSDLTNLLDLPVSDEPINIYLFKNFETYNKYLKHSYPEIPERRAFFVESDTKLTVYAYWGDRVAEDLRHEVAHGYLHAVVPNIPLWLDEGLAEYFEMPRGHSGLNRPHLALLLDRYNEALWSPKLERLESLTALTEMSQLEYAESWAWIHWLTESSPQRLSLLQQYLAELRLSGGAVPLSIFLRDKEPAPEQALIRHLQSFSGR
jgi:hypothetical protein